LEGRPLTTAGLLWYSRSVGEAFGTSLGDDFVFCAE
jgi:hypothetical protein